VSGHATAMAVAATTTTTQRQCSATPEAAEQWRINICQLVVVAINTPSHRRHLVHHSIGALALSHVLSRTPTSVVARAPEVALVSTRGADHGHAVSLATTDLRAKLDRRHSGEDDCTTIEHLTSRW
jgi:hypothetical protein